MSFFQTNKDNAQTQKDDVFGFTVDCFRREIFLLKVSFSLEVSLQRRPLTICTSFIDAILGLCEITLETLTKTKM